MFVHASRIRKQLEYLESKGIRTGPFLEEAGLAMADLEDPEKTVDLDQYIRVIEFAVASTGDNHFGLTLGQEPYLAGTVGMMCASCKNLGEAYREGCRYFGVQGDVARIEFLDDDHFPAVRYTPVPAWTLGSPETARQEVEIMFSFLVTIARVNSNGTILPYRVNLTGSLPTDPRVYETAFGVIPAFGREHNEIIFRARDLLIPMKAFNPETLKLLRAHVESQLRRIGGRASISDRVRSILLSSLRYSFPDMETVASRLNMSPRTLQRQLSNEKTCFKHLLQDTRFELARGLLKQEEFTISEISYMLGYSDLANFSRSFKRHAGVSPQEFRNEAANFN
jgi:AraC-like DNA-binding protein